MIPPDGIVEYQYAQIAGPMTKDTYIKAIDVEVNKSVVHHTNFIVSDQPFSRERMNRMYDGSEKLGKGGRLITRGRLKKGSFVVPRTGLEPGRPTQLQVDSLYVYGNQPRLKGLESYYVIPYSVIVLRGGNDQKLW